MLRALMSLTYLIRYKEAMLKERLAPPSADIKSPQIEVELQPVPG